MASDDFVFPRDADLALLAGFVDPERVLGHQECKDTAGRLRARVIAVELASTAGPAVKMKVVATKMGVSDRTLKRWFPLRDALLAFPPPEFARALVSVGLRASSWSGAAMQARMLFSVLDVNPTGRRFLADLAALHRDHPQLRAVDGHFAAELRGLLKENSDLVGGRAVAMVGLFTEGIRAALEDWANTPEASLVVVADAVTGLLTGSTLDGSS